MIRQLERTALLSLLSLIWFGIGCSSTTPTSIPTSTPSTSSGTGNTSSGTGNTGSTSGTGSTPSGTGSSTSSNPTNPSGPSTPSTPNSNMKVSIKGNQQAVSGATIQLYAASSSGYGAASTPLLTSTVTTDANGLFDITGLYTCPSNTTQVYLTAKGGNPGLSGTVNNTALTLMAPLGSCGDLSDSTHVVINEVTTVAGVWALAPFMTAYDHVGTSSTNSTGLVNAFAMAKVLVSVESGQSPGNTPTGAVVATAEINTLANVLSSCVSTSGGSAGDSTPCGNLFATVPSNGGNAQTETVGAALSIANHPGTAVSGIYTLGTAGTPPFQPALTSAPNDWTIATTFPTGSTSQITAMAVDASGNIWVQNGSLQEISPTGTLLGSYAAMAGTTIAIDASGNFWAPTGTNAITEMPSTFSTPVTYAAPGTSFVPANALAIDANGGVWYTCSTCQNVSKLNSTGTPLFTSSIATGHDTNIAIDTSGNAWIGNVERSQVDVVTNSGSKYLTSPFSCGSCNTPTFVASDGNGNVWLAGRGITKMTSSGSYTNFGSTGNPIAGASSPQGLAIDGAGNIWAANNVPVSNATAGSISELDSTGMAISPFTGYVSSQSAQPFGIALDSSGNVWTRNSTSPTLTVFVGAAAPAATPLASALTNGTIGTRP